MQNKLFEMLTQENEITWQNIIYDLIRSEEIDPWDIDISLLANKYLETVKKLKEMNFAISGRVILASSILLKLKSKKLIEEDLARFEEIINPLEDVDLLEDSYKDASQIEENDLIIIPKTPQPRKRKVSINDLVAALKKALEIEKRRRTRHLTEIASIPKIEIPERKININELIKKIYSKIVDFFKTNNQKLTFNKLVNSPRKEDKIATFVPLLHLDFQRKINLEQKQHFGEIEILMNKFKYH